MTARVSSPNVLETLRSATSGRPGPVTGRSPSASFSAASAAAGPSGVRGSTASTEPVFYWSSIAWAVACTSAHTVSNGTSSK